VLITLAAGAALAGFLVGRGGGGGEEQAEAFTNTASAGSVGLSFPAGWERVPEEPNVPGVRFRDPLVLAPDAPARARLVAGNVAASGPALLSAGLLDRLSGGAPQGEPVRLNDLEALRYRGLEPGELAGQLQLYAVPTTRGVATVACTAPGGAQAAGFRRDCESVAATLELAGAEPYPLGPSTEYASRLRGVTSRLAAARRTGTERLRGADTPDAQAAALSTLAGVYRRAASAVADTRVSPADRAANLALAGALERTRAGYARAAEAARAGDSEAYSAAGEAVGAGQRAFARALTGLERLGYVLP
jgi:hypothetical protein